jgi:hypothetical protein
MSGASSGARAGSRMTAARASAPSPSTEPRTSSQRPDRAPTRALLPAQNPEQTHAPKLENDGLALTNARWSLDGVDADGNAVQMAGRGTIVSRRLRDGTWLIALDRPISPD